MDCNNRKTFTTDSLLGYENEDLKEIEEHLDDNLRPIIKEFVKFCNDNNIETCSSDYVFYNSVYTTLNMERMKLNIQISKEINKNE